jgi:acetyl esterase/lipase
MASRLITYQPIKSIFLLFSVALITARIPFWIVYFVPSFLRQHPEWTYKQALAVRVLKGWLNSISLAEHGPSTPLRGKVSKGWVVIQPAKSNVYTGVVIQDKEIKPEPIGGTWYPKTLEKYNGGEIVLHTHGGAFVVGDGRPGDSGFTAKTILKNTKVSHVFFPQYRLSSNGARFPAALQDVITSYHYLTEALAIPAEKITVSGDSAGGNLTLSLLRYIADNPKAGLPNPGCAWLWSMWADPGTSLITDAPFFASNTQTDYLTDTFTSWGARTYKPSPESGLTLAHPNICFVGTPFATPTPVFFSVGECEGLYPDIVKVYEGLKTVSGNKVDLYIENKAAHDIILVGPIIGFEKQADEAARRANRFLEGCK